jgi:integrase
MSVFKVHTGKRTSAGKPVRSTKFYIEFKDHGGIRRRVPAFKGRKESEQLERTIEQLVACRHNTAMPGEGLVRAVEAMPARVRNRLTDFGVLDIGRRHAGHSIDQHLDEFTAELQAGGASDKWARTVRVRALRIFERAGCRVLSDITEGSVMVAADELRKVHGFSDQTHNHGLAACKAFTKWATPGRMSLDPLANLKGRPNAERVHRRRALTAVECRDLLTAAESGVPFWGLPGPERALVYRLALETGLRANEIRTLTRSAFVLEGRQPSVAVEARHAKNRKTAVLPLRPVLAGLLSAHLKLVLPEAQAFAMPESTHTAEMLRKDLKVAGIEYVTSQGFADFHALRHTFITNLARGGVMPDVARELARHSSIRLTMDLYTHTRLVDTAAAVRNLPDLDAGRTAGKDSA